MSFKEYLEEAPNPRKGLTKSGGGKVKVIAEFRGDEQRTIPVGEILSRTGLQRIWLSANKRYVATDAQVTDGLRLNQLEYV